jgi:hypothetical protein
MAYDCSSIGPNPTLVLDGCVALLLSSHTIHTRFGCSLSLSPNGMLQRPHTRTRSSFECIAHPPTNSPLATHSPPTNSPLATHSPPTNSPLATHSPPTNSPLATALLTQIVHAGSTRDAAAAGAPHAQAHSVRRRVSKPFARRGGTTSRVGCAAHGSFARAKQ